MKLAPVWTMPLSRSRTRQSLDPSLSRPKSGDFGYYRWLLLPLLLIVTCPSLEAADNHDQAGGTLPGLEVRFADAATSEVPDFQRHVTPLLGRLGCNGRACHGSFQGRGGLQLSLFGYDFAADHAALMAENSGRVDPDDVDESLIIAKPTDADMHEGGKRYDKDSWQYNVIRSWVASGASYDAKQPARLTRLEIQPQEIVFQTDDQQQPLQVIAHWDSGVSENVTEICRFTSNDDSIAEIDENGMVTAGAVGDTYVVAYYDKAVVPIPVLRPVTDLVGTRYPNVETHTTVDELVVQKLRKLGVTPSDVCTDADFLRRVRLDLTGTLPSPAEVESFLNDSATNKRAELVDRLLGTPEYSAWWATRFSDWTGNSEAQLNNVLPVRGVATKMWFAWLQKRLAENVPYDQLVEGMVTAESRMPDEDYEEYCAAMTAACGRGNEDTFADRDGMPLYWARRNFRTTDERAIGFAYAFMGIRIQCAQCHKHPFDQWSKDDFAQFGRLFQTVVAGNGTSPESKSSRDQMMAQLELDGLRGGDLRKKISQLLQEGKTVPFPELYVRTINARPERKGKNKNRKTEPVYPTGKILGVEEVVSLGTDPRERLMDWLRAADNPYFSKSLVNRVWANYFGIGLVQPTDDLNLANPPVNVPLMDYLSQGFVDSGFDLQWLHREIVLSDTYQRSWQPNDTNASDKRNFSHYIPHRMPAEVVHDAVLLATLSDDQADEIRESLGGRAIAGGLSPQYRGQSNFALSVFGQSIRETNCDCDRSDDSSLLQSVYLRNDAEVHARLTDKKGWVANACRTMGVAPPAARGENNNDQLDRQRKNLQRQLTARRKQLQELNEKQLAVRGPKLKVEIQRLRDRLTGGADSPALPHSDQSTAQAASQTDDVKQAIQQAYLRTLSRYPEPTELERSMAYVHESPSVAEGMESVVWSLINTKEFILNH